MSKMNKKAYRVLQLLLLTLLLLPTAGKTAQAKTVKRTCVLTEKGMYLDTTQLSKKYKKVKVKSSKSSVVKVSKVWKESASESSMGGGYFFNTQIKRTGKATVTIKCYKKGKKKPSKTTVIKYTVLPYSNPFASFKIGSADITSEFKTYRDTSDDEIKVNGRGKPSITLSSGWKFKEAYAGGTDYTSLAALNAAKLYGNEWMYITVTRGSSEVRFYLDLDWDDPDED